MATALGGVGDDAGGAGSRPRHCTRFWKEVSGGGLDVRLHGHVVAGGGQKVRGGSSVAVLSHDGTAATKEGRKRRKSFPRYGERGAPADLPHGLWVRPSGGVEGVNQPGALPFCSLFGEPATNLGGSSWLRCARHAQERKVT